MAHLKVFAQVWCEIDPTLNVRVDRSSGEPCAEEGDVLTRVSPGGRYGVAAARSLPDAHVTAFAIGDGHTAALRHALAAGAHEAVLLTGATAPAVAQWLGEQGADLVIADRTAGSIAGRLGWAHLAGISDLTIENGRLHAVRHLGRGDREEVTAQLPAAVRLQLTSPPPYVSRARLVSVAKENIVEHQLIAVTTAAIVDVGPYQPARARTRLAAAPQASSARGMDRLQALMASAGGKSTAAPTRKEPSHRTPEEMADELVRYLLHHELLTEHDTNPTR